MRNIAAIAILAAMGQFASAGVNFDGGVDVKAAISEAKASGVKAPAARFATPVDITRDCKKITFGASDPLTSAVVPLRSREEDQDCQNMGAPVGQICTPSFRDYSADAQIVVTQPRELKPGQAETFEVCLWGSFLSMKPVSTVYKYTVNRVLDVFRITPQGPVQPAAAKSATAQNVCYLAMDDGHFCTYRCKDGSYITNPNPFPTIPSPNPWVGPISTPCSPTAAGSPLITGQK